MTNIEKLTERLKENRHSGFKLGEFLEGTSNVVEYKIGILTMYLDAAKADQKEESDFMVTLGQSLGK